MSSDIEEDELQQQLRHIVTFLNEGKGVEAWRLAHPLLEKKDSFEPERTIDIVNYAGCAKLLLFSMQEGRELLEEGLMRSIALKYRFGEAFARCFLGVVLHNTGEPKKAIEYANGARILLEDSEESENKLLLGQVYIELGEAYRDLGQLQEAKTSMEQAIQVHRELSNKPGLYRVFQAFSHMYYGSGDFANAQQYAQEAAELAAELNNEVGVIRASSLLGVILKRQGRLHEARTAFQELNQKLEKYEDKVVGKELRLSINYNLGHTLILLGQHEAAKEIFLELLADENQDESCIHFTGSQGLGHLALFLGHYKEAAKYLETIASRIRSINPKFLSFVEELVALSTVYVELGEFEKARALLEEAKGIQVDSKYSKVFVSYGEGIFAQAKRNLELASESFRSCLKIANEMGLSEYIIRALFQLATLELFEYRISGDRRSLGSMNDFLEEAHQKARVSQMPLLALEIGILNGVACTATMEYDCALSSLEQSESLAQQLGFSRKLEEIAALIRDLREKRMQAAEQAVLEVNLADTQKITEYIDNVHKIIRTYSEGQGTGAQ